MDKKEYLTKEGLEKLKKELNYLKEVQRKEIGKLLKHTASFGDLSENAAYQEAKEEQAFLEGKILELEKTLKSAEIINYQNNQQVDVGSRVQIKLEGEKTIDLQIVGTSESNPSKGKISHLSPLGKALLGKKKGDCLKIKTPEGNVQYKILDLR